MVAEPLPQDFTGQDAPAEQTVAMGGEIAAIHAQPQREGLLRVRVHARGKATSVSLDAVLYGFLAGRLGGAAATLQWVQNIVLQIELLEEQDRIEAPRDVDASLSRLVQRAALRLLLGRRGGRGH